MAAPMVFPIARPICQFHFKPDLPKPFLADSDCLSLIISKLNIFPHFFTELSFLQAKYIK